MHQFIHNSSNRLAHLKRVLLGLAAFLLMVQSWTLPAAATGAYDFPTTVESSTWVIDQADILSRLTEGNLSQTFKSLAAKTGTEVRFVTVHRLDYGETAETLANQLFAQWFPTAEDQADQVILLLDNVTNDAAIVSGDSAKATLTPEIATSVVQDTLMYPLRVGNRYNQALADASDRMVAVLSGEPDPGPPEVEENIQVEGTFATPEETKESNAIAWVIGLLAAATIIPMATYYLYIILQSR